MFFYDKQKFHWHLVWLGLLFCVCWSVPTFAQEYGFDVWTTANGLPQNTVTGVAQTPEGYLWLSTFDGLARFDGVRFTIFDKGNSKGILNNRFACIFVDKEGAIWAATENGVVTVYRNGTFTSYPTPATLNGSLGIVSDANGKAVILSSNESNDGFYYLQDGKIIPIPDQKNGQQLYLKKPGATWIAKQGGMAREKDGQITNYPLSFSLPPYYLKYFYLVSYEDTQGTLWFAFKDKLF